MAKALHVFLPVSCRSGPPDNPQSAVAFELYAVLVQRQARLKVSTVHA